MTARAKLLTKTAASYEDMFKPLLAIAPDYSQDIKNTIQWAKRALKKENRIVWYLRWARLEMLWDALDFFERKESDRGAQPETQEQKDARKQKLTALFQKYNRELANKNGIGETETQRLSNGFMGTGTQLQNWLDHVFSLPYPAIQTYEPGYKTRTQVQADMEPLEEAFKRDAKSALKPKEEDTIWIDFNDGWAWWFLPRAACEDESGAMGHCGNSPERNRKDRAILSLRQKKQVGKEGRWEPHLTFILHTDPPGSDQGELGEMKGKGNAKPVERYHPYIIRLLEDPRIKGVIGGGYMPQNNFAFTDLTAEQQEGVHKANPNAYFTFDEYLEKADIDMPAIAARFGLEDYPSVDLDGSDGDGYAIEHWHDADEFVQSNGDENAKALQSCIDGHMGFFVEHLLRKIDSFAPVFVGIARQINREFPSNAIDIPEANALEDSDIVDEVCDALEAITDNGESVLRKGLEEAFLAGMGYTRTDTSLKELMQYDILDSVDNNGDGITGSIQINKNGSIDYYITARRLVELSRDNDFEEEEDRPDWAYPYLMPMDLDQRKLDEPGLALEMLGEKFESAAVSPKQLEERGQERLFKRPKTDEEAKRDGIHISYLLQPKTAASYDDMFKPLLALSAGSENEVKQEIAWAKRVLKKQNRITWYLRWYRLALVEHLLHGNELGLNAFPEDTTKKLKDLANRFTQELKPKAVDTSLEYGFDGDGKRYNWTKLKTDLEHYYGLPDEKIAAYDPGFAPISEAMHALYQLEQNFKERAKGSIIPKEKDTIFLECDANWAWWLLPRASCDDESKAMGHCGNSPNSGRDDMNILSLRQKKVVGPNDVRWEPHLTFILHLVGDDDHGTLGEMKGRGNDKPVPRYFPYIVMLLKDQRIIGIDGGGYLPEHNFAFEDLTPEQQAEVEEENPDVTLSFKDYIREHGLDEYGAARVATRLGIENNLDSDGFVIREWDNFTAFIDDCGDTEARALAKYLNEGDLGLFVDHMLDDVDDESPCYKGIAAQLLMEFPATYSNTDFESPTLAKDVRKTLSDMKVTDEDSPLRSKLEEAFTDAMTAKLSESQRKWHGGESLQDKLDEGVNNSTEGSPTNIGYNSGITQYIDENYAIDLAMEDHRFGNSDQPYVYVNLEIDDDTATAALEQLFDHTEYNQRLLEQQGQDRLFKRPETDEEAKRDGIHISYLLQPKGAATIKQALNVSETGRQYMQLSGDEIADEATVGDYELFVLKSGVIPGTYLLGMQRIGNDAFDLGQQMQQQVQEVGRGTRAEIREVLDGWLQKYGKLVIGSHNPEKTRKYETLLKWLGYTVKSESVMGIDMPYVEKAGEPKTAYVSPVNGEITLSIDLGARPTVMISLDLGIPNFTVFTISVPVENLSNTEIDLFVRQAFEALLQNVTAFLVTMKYPEDMVAEVLSNAESAFMELGGDDASDAGMPDQDRVLRMYEGNFTLPEEFIYQTRDKVVTAGVVRRTPEIREIILTPLDAVTPTGTPAASIEFYLDQITKSTPRAFSVQVIDTAQAEKRRGPKAREWESRLLQAVA